MSIKEDLDKLISDEKEALRRHDQAYEEHKKLQITRFRSLTPLLEELGVAVGNSDFKISLNECDATLCFQPQRSWSQYRWEIWPDYSHYPDGRYESRQGYYVKEQLEVGFIFENGRKFAGPDFDLRENSFVLPSETEVIEYLTKLIAKVLATEKAK